MTKEYKVLDQGHVILEGHYGDDLAIVNSARISNKKRTEVFREQDKKLIEFLMRNKHSTPFEVVDFTFRIKAPKPVVVEWMRHRTSSFNETSQRYVKWDPEFYVPAAEHIRGQVGKPGHYTFEPITDLDTLESVRYIMQDVYAYTYTKYEDLLNLGCARELARNVLAFGFYTEFIYKANLRSIFNFLSLRNDEHALLEIREYAKVIEDFVAQTVPCAYEAWVENGRQSI